MFQDGSTERDNVKLSPEEARELIKAIEGRSFIVMVLCELMIMRPIEESTVNWEIV